MLSDHHDRPSCASCRQREKLREGCYRREGGMDGGRQQVYSKQGTVGLFEPGDYKFIRSWRLERLFEAGECRDEGRARTLT